MKATNSILLFWFRVKCESASYNKYELVTWLVTFLWLVGSRPTYRCWSSSFRFDFFFFHFHCSTNWHSRVPSCLVHVINEKSYRYSSNQEFSLPLIFKFFQIALSIRFAQFWAKEKYQSHVFIRITCTNFSVNHRQKRTLRTKLNLLLITNGFVSVQKRSFSISKKFTLLCTNLACWSNSIQGCFKVIFKLHY